MEDLIDWREVPALREMASNPTMSRLVDIIWIILKFKLWVFDNTNTVTLSLFLIIGAYYAMRWYKYYKEKYTYSMLPQTVLAVRPGVCTTKWNEIACKMNKEFYFSSFADGEECHRFFREHFSEYTSKPDYFAAFDATKHYTEAITELYKDSLQGDFPSNPKYLPVNEQYGEYKWLIFSLPILKKKRILFSLQDIASVSFGILGEILCDRKFPSFSYLCELCFFIRYVARTYQSHSNAKYNAISVVQCVKFLATVAHFAPGGDLEKWDHIASNMNWYMRATGKWAESYERFLDGKECFNYYDTQLMPSAAKSGIFKYSGLQEIVDEANKACAPL